MPVLIDTTTVERRERAEQWAVAHERLFFPVDVSFSATGSSHGLIEGREFGPVGAYRVRSDPSIVSRRRAAISIEDPERFLIGAPLAGSCSVAQAGRSCPFTVGELSSWESSRPFEVIHHSPFELLLVVIPTGLLGLRRDAITNRTAVRRSASSGVGLLAASLFAQIWEQRVGVGVGVGEDDVADAMLALIRAIHRVEHEPDAQPVQLPSRVLLSQIKAHIRSNLGDPRLTPESIARTHYISTRYLHKLFATEEMTVSEWIRHGRLEACRRDLCAPELAHQPIAAIARRWALADPTHFSRLFRAAYGCTPSEFRRQALTA